MKARLLLTMLIATTMVAVCNVAKAETVTLDVTKGIALDNNDMEEKLNTLAIGGDEPQGTMDLVSSDLELGSEGGDGLNWQVIGIQFGTLGIPQGATINSATITFTIDNNGNPGDNNFTIYAEAIDNSTIFAGTDFNITSRTLSNASVAWTPAAINDDSLNGTTIETPDIALLIQEIVDQEGWSDNNLLTLMIYPDAYLDLPDPATGGTTVVQELELEAFEDGDSRETTLSVNFTFTVPPPPIMPSSQYAIAGLPFSLTAPLPDGALDYQWSDSSGDIFDGGNISGTDTNVLAFAPVQEADAETYTITYDDGELKTIVEDSYDLVVFPAGSTIPVTGLLGLGLLAGACALAGASALRRKK